VNDPYDVINSSPYGAIALQDDSGNIFKVKMAKD
jgi:hypothetical protein